MTEIFDEYGNYIFPSDVPSEPCTATSIPFRDATKEELDSVKSYIKSISIKTGVSFYDFV